MITIKPVMVAAVLLACASARADGGGSFTFEGKTFALKGAYAYSHPNPFDK